jgi:hypothetical protein
MTSPVTPIHSFPDTTWAEGISANLEHFLEQGEVLSFPQLSFELLGTETHFLDPRYTNGKAKNISLRWPSGEMRGAATNLDVSGLQPMMLRYAEQSEAFAHRLFPHYTAHLKRGGTSFRPVNVVGRERSWRQDDSRLHVDAFPSNPMQGTRLLRVFCNINPEGQPREWRVGERFGIHAQRYADLIKPQWWGSAWLLEKMNITKRRRSPYDHAMLMLHDMAKADLSFQKNSPQANVAFAPGTTWVVFSDQVPHAAMGGQHMLEQTFYLSAGRELQPERSPQATLERLLGRSLGHLPFR